MTSTPSLHKEYLSSLHADDPKRETLKYVPELPYSVESKLVNNLKVLDPLLFKLWKLNTFNVFKLFVRLNFENNFGHKAADYISNDELRLLLSTASLNRPTNRESDEEREVFEKTLAALTAILSINDGKQYRENEY